MAWWDLLKLVADKGISNINEQERGEKQGEQMNRQNRDPRMTYANVDQNQEGKGLTTAQNVDRLAGWGDGSVQKAPWMAQPAEMEKGVGISAPAEGGFSLQPSKVDSSQSSAPSSGMQNYLNYMKYRGGYR